MQLCQFAEQQHPHTRTHAHTGCRWLGPSMFSCPRRQCRHTYTYSNTCMCAGDMVAGRKRYLNRPLEHVLPEMQQKAAIFARSQLSKGVCCSGCSLNWSRNKGSNSFNLINTVGPHGEWVTNFQAINRIRLYLTHTHTHTSREILWNPCWPNCPQYKQTLTTKDLYVGMLECVFVPVCATKPEANG